MKGIMPVLISQFSYIYTVVMMYNVDSSRSRVEYKQELWTISTIILQTYKLYGQSFHLIDKESETCRGHMST